MPSMPSHSVVARQISWSPLALVAMAGLAVISPPVIGDEPGADKPGTYAVIDGKHAPIPDIKMGDPAMVAKIIAEGKNNNHVMDQITYISNTIGARLTGSSATEKAGRTSR